MIQPLFVMSDWALLATRLVVGIIFLAHGWPKIKDLRSTASSFEMMGFKPGSLWGTLIAILEVFGGVSMILGFMVQPLGLLFAIEMLVAILWVKRGQGLSGYEFDLALLAASLVLATLGGGALALDSFWGIVLY